MRTRVVQSPSRLGCQGRGSAGQLCQPAGDPRLGPVELGQEEKALAVDVAGDQPALLDGIVQAFGKGSLGQPQQVGRLVDGLWCPGRRVAVLGRLADHLEEPGPPTDRGVAGDLQLGRQEVGGGEADAANVARQEVGVGEQPRDGILAISLEDAPGAGRADALAFEEDEDVAALALAAPDIGDAPCRLGADARHLGEALRGHLDHLAEVLAELLDQLGRHHLADALDRAGCQIGLDAGIVDRRQQRDGRGGELAAPARIVLPVALGAHDEAWPALRRAADHGHRLGSALDLDAEHGETRGRLLEHDLLDSARNDPALGHIPTRLDVAPNRATDRQASSPGRLRLGDAGKGARGE